ncbi:MAG: DUF4296 domain-containing protein, partial [Flavobacteriales bacterium]
GQTFNLQPMKLRLICVAIVVAMCSLLACNTSSEEKKPGNLISEEKMNDVLVDVRLLEGAYSGDFQRVDSSQYAIDSYYEQLFAKHQITRAAFLESSEYYALHPEVLLRIETEVGKKLEALSVEQGI